MKALRGGDITLLPSFLFVFLPSQELRQTGQRGKVRERSFIISPPPELDPWERGEMELSPHRLYFPPGASSGRRERKRERAQTFFYRLARISAWSFPFSFVFSLPELRQAGGKGEQHTSIPFVSTPNLTFVKRREDNAHLPSSLTAFPQPQSREAKGRGI